MEHQAPIISLRITQQASFLRQPIHPHYGVDKELREHAYIKPTAPSSPTKTHSTTKMIAYRNRINSHYNSASN
jgi:hypothetical protein